ncbi:lamin tail domain-containing protein [Candidatus Woesearchaeota archaeon]|nr:lamin tail domain-containing protein [Candidatus Woesearchaeota archaeon]
MGRWNYFLGVILLILFSAGIVAALQIQEIAYDPSDAFGGQLNEWVELWNDGNESLNLSGCFLDKKPLPSLVVSSGNFTIVARKPELFKNMSSFNGTIIPLSLSLANGGDTIVLNGTCSAQATYTPTLGASKNNKTLERRQDNTWGESLFAGGSPGEQNSIWENGVSSIPKILITEFLPNPAGADDAFLPQGEWIEIYNNGSRDLDLRGTVLMDNSGGKLFLSDTNVQGGQLSSLCSRCYLLVYRNGDSDFSLDNDYDEIILLDQQQNPLATMSYSGSKEGFSWQYNGSQWLLATPTPLSPFFADESCDIALSLQGNPISNTSKLLFSLTVENPSPKPVSITVSGMITTVSGSVVKEYTPWTNVSLRSSLQKEYSPTLPSGLHLVIFSLDNFSCSDRQLENNVVKRLYLLQTGENLSQTESTIVIEKIYLGSDETARWGDLLSLRLSIFKGNGTKNEVRLWAEADGKKVSTTTSFLLKEKYHLSTLTVPLQLDSRCEESGSEEVTIVVEGLGQRMEKVVSVEGISKDLCKTTTIYSTATATTAAKSKAASLSLEVPPSVVAGDVLRVIASVKGAVKDKDSVDYSLSGYVYTGRTCYSCLQNSVSNGREIASLSLRSGEERTKNLLLQIDPDVPEGMYKVKVRLLQEGLKTPKEATAEIFVRAKPTVVEQAVNSSFNSSPLLLATPSLASRVQLQTQTDSSVPGIVVYESTSAKSKKTTPYFLIISLALLVVAVVAWRP